MGPRVALATSQDHPSLSDDDQVLLAELAALGIEAVPTVWTAEQVEWDQFDLVVIRSTWDYSADRPRFLAWAQELERLENPVEVLRWNTDKSYLATLTMAGLPVVATTIAVEVEALELPAGPVVLKPSVGAGSRGVRRFGAEDHGAARAYGAQLLDAGHQVVIQPYLDAVEVEGEVTCCYLDGVFSHAVRKGPMLTEPDGGAIPSGHRQGRVEVRPYVASHAEREVAEMLLAATGSAGCLYARVDLLPGDAGPLLVELELTEPFLFFGTAPAAAARFAAAIAGRLR